LNGITAEAGIRHYPTIDSTNLEAHRLFSTGERGPLFLLADEQTAGKGRLDRNWASLRGNCYSTLILPVKADVQAIPQIGFVAALAVADVVHQHSKGKPQLKWPNDVLVQGAKIAGILCEVLSLQPQTMAIGCGINVAHSPSGLPYPATCLAAIGATTDRNSVFQSYREALSYWLGQWNNGQNFLAIREAWVKQAIGIGETVSMIVGSRHLTGNFETITEQGAILLKPVDSPHQILHAGDLHIPSLARLRNGTI
jgi:BirA family transcriptional regulator, biotin operon repressor / biotin---[acetyl-CoA-carboxylase] ligase